MSFLCVPVCLYALMRSVSFSLAQHTFTGCCNVMRSFVRLQMTLVAVFYIYIYTHKMFQQFFQPKFPSGFHFSFSAFESKWWHKQPPCLSTHFRCMHTYGFIFASWTNLTLKPIYLHIKCGAVAFVTRDFYGPSGFRSKCKAMKQTTKKRR